MDVSNFSRAVLSAIQENQDISDGIQDIVFGNRPISLVIVFLFTNFVLLSVFFMSKSAIGLGTLYGVCIIVIPIFSSKIKSTTIKFLSTPMPNELNFVTNITFRKTNEQFAAAIATISETMGLKRLLMLFSTKVMKSFVGFRMIFIALITTAIFATFGFIVCATFINSFIGLAIYSIRTLCK